MVSGCLQGRKLHILSGQPVPVLIHLHSKVLPDFQMEPLVVQFVPTATCPICGFRPGSNLFTPSLQVFTYIDDILPRFSFSRLYSPRSFSFYTQARCSSSLFILVVLCWTPCFSFFPTLLPCSGGGFPWAAVLQNKPVTVWVVHGLQTDIKTCLRHLEYLFLL